ncbi:hypothetical protein G3A_07235 [Bacillus sp. 17376]|uniref:Uncharacterized protein n=1 Tax=Mesobacillus boroniphilus JCM 21738 TaxID=1294265 RepID=W4RWA4_9BACI|nr:hypothetical protein [Mesobacillus boroniphilus]ESU33251.1 hypothetical protein G3A_07235 [Bacillus sp. 17376]GAE48153.1 hypothetical protein JCM21738_5237 [Mesobacillus boroniphilus JCM 21738]
MSVINIWVTILLAVAFLAAIGAWLNTRIILKDLDKIKAQLGIKEERTPSVFDNDLDKE